VILLAHRLPATSLHWTNDEGKTWHGPVQIDSVVGAYPSMVELPNGQVYCVYYEEGKGSSIRGVRLRGRLKGSRDLSEAELKAVQRRGAMSRKKLSRNARCSCGNDKK